ncbi:hypothetical protein ACFU6S_06360 [Streptomyces sp. NPDC057456]|uniref:hypothetical protein n=1 Tax=Streptomyces sp. NPDC057456 TaxID=3346139 RepID=UPI00369744DF
MTDTTEPETRRVQLEEDRVDEIPAHVQPLGGWPDPSAVRGLLADANVLFLSVEMPIVYLCTRRAIQSWRRWAP